MHFCVGTKKKKNILLFLCVVFVNFARKVSLEIFDKNRPKWMNYYFFCTQQLAVVKTTSMICLWNIFHKKLMITSIAEFSHSYRTIAFSHDQVDRIFPVIHNDHTYITEDYTSLCLNIICNRSFFILKWCQLCFGPSFTQGWKDIGEKTYLFTAWANYYLWF
jgi:hypothetical protein